MVSMWVTSNGVTRVIYWMSKEGKGLSRADQERGSALIPQNIVFSQKCISELAYCKQKQGHHLISELSNLVPFTFPANQT